MLFHIVVVAMVAKVAGGCAPEGPYRPATPEELAQRTVRVAVTIAPIAEAVQRIGKTRVEVTGLMGPAVDPHSYSATPADVAALHRADAIFLVGLQLEGAMGNLLDTFALERPQTVKKLVDAVPSEQWLTGACAHCGHRHAVSGNHDHALDQTAYDPHIWLDVELWMHAVACIRDTLAAMDAHHAEHYRTNAEAYLNELRALHAEIQAASAAIPAERRVLVTTHDAFGYFARAYGFETRALQGTHPDTEAGVRDRQALAAFLISCKIPAVFVENTMPERPMQAVRDTVRAEGNGFTVDLGGKLYDVSPDATGAITTYAAMMRHNIHTIARALTPNGTLSATLPRTGDTNSD